MRRAHFELLVSNVRLGTGSDALSHLMATAADLVNADVAFLGLVAEGRVEVLSGYQLPFYAKREWQLPPKISARLAAPLFCRDPAHAELEAAYPDEWSFLLSAPLRMGDGDSRLVLACVGYGAAETVPSDALDRLQAIAGSCSFQLRLLAELLVRDKPLSEVQPQPITFAAEQLAPYQPETECNAAPTEVTAEFILKTLVQARRMTTRNGVSYTTTAKWRTAIKDWQIIALRALKKQPPPTLLEAAAEKVLQAAHDLVGKGGFTSVVSVPCGHSGPGCFSSLLAQAIASRAGVRCIPLFEDMCLAGSSHPKTNATRPKMRISGLVDPSDRVLLVDDVATSGAHIAEATNLLRQAGCAVLPIAWIGA
jgi:hypothetical protein